MNINLVSFSYNYIFGESRMPKTPHHFVGRNYPFIVLVYVDKGEYHVVADNIHYTLCAGEAIVIPEFTNHEVYMENEGVLSWAHFSSHIFGKDVLSFFKIPMHYRGSAAELLGNAARDLCELSGLDQSAALIAKNGTHFSKTPQQSDADIYSHADLAPLLDADVCNSIRLKASYDRLISTITAGLISRAWGNIDVNEKDYQWISEVSQYIHENIKSRLTLDGLAAHFKMSVRSFSMKFKATFHQSPIAYVINEKIRNSAWMLLNGASIKTTALTLGFTDSYYFSRMFKNVMGVSPSKYKEDYLKEADAANPYS